MVVSHTSHISLTPLTARFQATCPAKISKPFSPEVQRVSETKHRSKYETPVLTAPIWPVQLQHRCFCPIKHSCPSACLSRYVSITYSGLFAPDILLEEVTVLPQQVQSWNSPTGILTTVPTSPILLESQGCTGYTFSKGENVFKLQTNNQHVHRYPQFTKTKKS